MILTEESTALARYYREKLDVAIVSSAVIRHSNWYSLVGTVHPAG